MYYYLIFKNYTKCKKASMMVFVPPSSIYGWVNGDSDEQLLKLQKKYKILKEGKWTYNYNWQCIKIQCHQFAKKKHRTFYAPFTRGREQVYIYFVPTNI